MASDKFTMEVGFPAGIPKPHEARKWARAIEAALTARGLTDVARHQLPAGHFDAPWPAAALELPPPPPDGSRYGDILSYRKLSDEITKRLMPTWRGRRTRQSSGT